MTIVLIIENGYQLLIENGYQLPFERKVQHKNWRCTVKIQ
jgi:hypothetical protein